MGLLEIFYNVIEATVITVFILSYFNPKPRLSRFSTAISTFFPIIAANTFTTIFNPSWMITFIIVVTVIFAVIRLLYTGSALEQLLIAFVINSLVAIIDLSTFTLMSKAFNTEYRILVNQSGSIRFITVIITKVIFLLITAIIASFKKKYTILIKKLECIMISTTLLASSILLPIVRNIIYESKKNYDAFLIIVLCLLVLIFVQYYTMIHISRKNISQQEISLMKKQMEMQEESIRDLEKKDDETAKIRHDMKNYVSCALNLAKSGETDKLIDYLQEVSDKRIKNISSIVETKRKVIGVVINSKLKEAEQNDIETHYTIMSEMESIPDIDVGILLANLFDNAIEACERNKGHSEIYLKMWCEAGYYCLELTNTVESNILADNPDLKTVKKDSKLHGIGLRSIKDIVEKYNGMISFKQVSNRFSVYVSLCKDDF